MLRRLTLFIILVLLTAPQLAAADSSRSDLQQKARFTLNIGPSHGAESSPLVRNVAAKALELLDVTHDELSRIFRFNPEQQIVLSFLSPQEFRKRTGAPSWTSAMFFRGEISIPLRPGEPVNIAELSRALRHEYSHAVIAELSGYRSPAWIDEGLAQLIEGHPNPLLGPALRRWIDRNDIIPLRSLEHGFTSLDSEIVPAAYAQSLFATRMLLRSHGMKSIVSFLTELKSGKSVEDSFELAFNKPLGRFEVELQKSIQAWSKSEARHP